MQRSEPFGRHQTASAVNAPWPSLSRRRALALCLLVAAPGIALAQVHQRWDFEDGKLHGWRPARAHVSGKAQGTLPRLRLSAGPKQPTHGGSRFALCLDDPVGDSVEACAVVNFPPVTITANTTVSCCFRWAAKAAGLRVNARVPTGGNLKYAPSLDTNPGEWHNATAKVAEFTRGTEAARLGDTFDSLTVRMFGSTDGWRRLWIDNVVVYEGPDTTRPSAVQRLEAKQQGAHIVLEWQPAEDDIGVAHYAVHRSADADASPGPSTCAGTTCEPSFADLAAERGPMCYRVVAVDYGGNGSDACAAISIEARRASVAAPKLSAPADGETVLAGKHIALRWDAAPGAAAYWVQCARDGRFLRCKAERVRGTSTKLKHLEPGTWHWRVVPADAAGRLGEPSGARSVHVRRYYETVRPGPHPRLYFTAEDIPELRAATQVEPTKTMWKRVEDACAAMLAEPPTDYTPSDRWGTFCRAARRATNNIEALTLRYVLTGDRACLAKAKEQVKTVLSWDCWVDPVHGGAKARADLATGEICRALGTFYDWAYGALSPEERIEIRQNLVRRGIVPIYERSLQGASWSRTYSNWCAVVHGGAGVAALAVMDEEPRASEWLEQIEAKIRCYLDTFDSQGGWVEGPGYWGYGISYALWFTDAARRATRGERDLFRHDRLAETLNFVLYCTTPDRLGTVNFADSWYGPFGTFQVRRLAAEYQNPFAAWLVSRSSRAGLWDLLWHKGLPPPQEPTASALAPAILFPDIHWAVLREGWFAPKGCFLAIKGGTNYDWHGHRDMAHFILNAYGKRLLIDQGGGVYRKEYWQGQDYEVRSEGHNTLLLDGKGQDRNRSHSARITEFFHSPSVDYVLCDASKAYGARLERFSRHVVYLRPDVFVLFDDVVAAKPCRVESLLHTLGRVEVKGAWLSFEDQEAALFAKVLSPAKYTHSLCDGTPQRPERMDRFVRFGPAEPMKQIRFLLAMRPVERRTLPDGVWMWEDFEDCEVGKWTPGRAHVAGKEVGHMPVLKPAAQPEEPTYKSSKGSLLLDDSVGDSPEACATVRFPKVTVTPETRVTFACRWESESGKGGVTARINAGNALKYIAAKDAPVGQWTRVSARAVDFRRGSNPGRVGETFDALTIRITGTGEGWRKLWIDDVAVHEGSADALAPPVLASTEPEAHLSAEQINLRSGVGLKVARPGEPDAHVVLFRSGPSLDYEGCRTDARVCALGMQSQERLSYCFVHRGTTLDWRGAAWFRSSTPVSVWLWPGRERVQGVIDAPAPATAYVRTGARPKRLLIDGQAAAVEFDAATGLCRLSIGAGRHRLDAEF